MTNDLVSMNIVVDRKARDKLDIIMQKLDIKNIHDGVKKSIEIAFEKLEEKK